MFVSAASIWEIAIKARLGKIDADPDALVAAIDASGFIELPVRAAQAARVGALPRLHTDPFDRLLIAQAIAEPLRLLTADAGAQGLRGARHPGLTQGARPAVAALRNFGTSRARLVAEVR